MISVCFQGKPFNITVIQAYALTSNAEEAEVEQLYEDLQDLPKLTPKKDVLYIIGDCNVKSRKSRDTWLPVLHHLPEFAQIHVLSVGDAIQTSHSLLPPSPPAFNLSQHQALFK